MFKEVIDEVVQDGKTLLGNDNPVFRSVAIATAMIIGGGLFMYTAAPNSWRAAFMFFPYEGSNWLASLVAVALALVTKFRMDNPLMLRKLLIYVGAAMLIWTLYNIRTGGLELSAVEAQQCLFFSNDGISSMTQMFAKALGADASDAEMQRIAAHCNEVRSPGYTFFYFPALGGWLYLIGFGIMIRAGLRVGK